MQLSRAVSMFALLLPVVAALSLGACGQAVPEQEPHVGASHENAPMLYTVSSSHSIEALTLRIEKAAKNHKFGVVTTHNLRKMLEKKGVSFDRDVVVVEVCNPHHAKTVLSEDIGISAALPCRVSIYREGDVSILATMPPTSMIEMFGRESLRAVAQEVQDTLYAIMAEAAQ